MFPEARCLPVLLPWDAWCISFSSALMGVRLALSLVWLLASGSLSHPLEGSNSGGKAFIAKIRRSSGKSPAAQSYAQRIFDKTSAIDDLNNVLAKYADAVQILSGVGLNPDTHPEAGYYPFTHPLLGVMNSTNSTAPNVNQSLGTVQITAESMDGSGPGTTGIISVPGTAQQSLTDDVAGGLDILYYGALAFGSQKQTLTVDIDTGSADLWVPVNCRSCAGDSFHAAQSSSYQNLGQTFSVQYGAGKVSGTLAQDSVAVGALTAPQQVFGAVRAESSDFFDEPSDGLLGLAFGSIAQSKRPTFFENLMVSKQVTAGAFAIHLARGQSTGSEVCFGCFDTTKAIGPITWHPVISRTYWTIRLDGISSGCNHPLDVNLTAAIDTGTTLIYVPDDVAAQFYSLVSLGARLLFSETLMRPHTDPWIQYG
ncbi:uncharacterized protein FIBRA_07275 [Fibroporia radiculosa]|uniref:Peptidase A1 domain-containing protein n=1 Tax=Fibroporia radiculosa TaxID=599839 RepID=J4H4I8_9APHY|nr:uncharacterized protein FIBRA_07275 [Fibroporia radiculosa]CCM05069.1 predicted protein [Fibroporia radiculosa]